MRFKTVPLCVLFGLTSLAIDAAGQVAGDPGVIEFGSILVQISVEEDGVRIDGISDSVTSGDSPKLNRKLGLLAGRIGRHLAMIEAQEERQFSDVESLHRGTNYARKLVAKIALLKERIAYLGNQAEFIRDIEAAAAAFDVPRIKDRLAAKLALEDDNVAEASFQLAGFQELDGEYQDAWGNYQKASNLEPDNQLYMDAHGKNEF